ncbi:GAF domain-containing sensor histidine kinase [Anaerolineales bacterium HSG24]|nr:GAF domain-containing sensor histidine kinase [Anaerolineales bacterium HSG24]
MTNALLGVLIVIIVVLGIGASLLALTSFRYRRSAEGNDKKLAELKITVKQGELVAQMARVLSSTLDYREVLQKMIDLGLPAMGGSKGKKESKALGMALLFESSDVELNIAASRGVAGSDKKRVISRETSIINEAIQEAEAIIDHNINKEKALSSFKSLRPSQSAICAPLRVGLDTYGVVIFAHEIPEYYTEAHCRLLETLCSQVVIPLENAQLIEDLKREQQKILAKEEEARRKLARDLHDGPTQSLASIAMRLNFVKMLIKNKDISKAYEEIIKIEELGQTTVKDIRNMLFAMRPVVLETKGLIAALNGYAERLNAVESFRVTVKNKGYNNGLKTEHEGVLFAVVEEAVGNAKKHARAGQINITVEEKKGVLHLEIKDNGVGFDVEKTRSTYDQRSSLGMINLFERSEAIGGECHIDSASGKGTSVQITVPLK